MASKKWNDNHGGWRPRLALARCANCPPVGVRCSTCRSARRREVYAMKIGRQRGIGTTADGVPHMRCDACQDTVQCRACYNAQRIARRKARDTAAPAPAPVPRPRSGAKMTIPRCPACPEYGRPCHTCFRRHRNAQRAAKRETKAPTPGLVKAPRVRKEASPEQKAARAEALAAKQASAAAIKAAKALQEARERERGREGLLAEIARETRLSVCQVCQTRGRWEGNFCRRHQAHAAVPAGWGGATKSRAYTSAG